MGGESAILRKLAREVGEGVVRLSSKKAASRILGKLATNSRAWRKAFEHISLHFGPIAGKPSHSVFESAFRNRGAVEGLIRTAIRKLGRAPIAGRLTVHGVPEGTPCVLLEKEFKDVIGKINGRDCKILRIIVDYTGKPITAYPVDKFFGAAVAAKVLLSADGAEAAVPRVRAVQETYAEEETIASAMHENEIHRRGGGWIGKVVDMLTFDSSNTGLDRQEVLSSGKIAARANEAVQMIEARLGHQLDADTENEIRSDIWAIWGHEDP
jgi:hypothetical protein